MLPVQVIFDHQGPLELEVIGHQSFLEDQASNLWPILITRAANERATKYAQIREIFKEGAQKGFIGAAAGAVIGGVGGYASDEPNKAITNDIRDKSLQNAAIDRARNPCSWIPVLPGGGCLCLEPSASNH